MKTLFKNGSIVDVFLGRIIKKNVLIEDRIIVGIGDYTDTDADVVVDVSGKYICPGLIDGHIHIESSMLTPYEFTKAVLPCGVTTVITDPHEITNVVGIDGIKYMLQASYGLPLGILVMVPSCVPATKFDDSYESIDADKIERLYNTSRRILGLAEVMDYDGVVRSEEDIIDKIKMTLANNKIVDGHAPMLTGSNLDKYISTGIRSDHECSSTEEGLDRISRGQWLMIRYGSAAKNLHHMYDIFDSPGSRRCCLVTDDKEPSDILEEGLINAAIEKAVRKGKSVITGIQMATINVAECFRLEHIGGIAPGYFADILILDDLTKVHVQDVYKMGKLVVKDGKTLDFPHPEIDAELKSRVLNSVHCDKVSVSDMHIAPQGRCCNVIGVIPYELITEKIVMELDFDKNNGIDVDRDILKIAVVERHKNTGRIGLGYIHGLGLKEGAIASTVSHDSHNIICVGTSDDDMVCAINRIREIGGGNVVVKDGAVIKELPLPVGGLMTYVNAEETAALCKETRDIVHQMGVPDNIAPFMNMAFVSLAVIPHIKITARGLVDVDNNCLLPLFV